MIVISVDELEAANQIHRAISSELPSASVEISAGSRGFDGTIANDVIILAAIISPVAIKRIADVLVSLISAGAMREVSINGATVKGYSAEEVARILASSQGGDGAQHAPTP